MIQTQIRIAIGLNFDGKTNIAESTCMCFGNIKRTAAERALILYTKTKELQQSNNTLPIEKHYNLIFAE